MATVITAPILSAINNGLSLAFNTQLFRAPTVFRQFTYESPSDGAAEVYPGLDLIRGPREWLGARIAQQLSAHSFTIVNRKFEQTITIKRDDIEDDKVGLYTPIASEIGMSAAQFPELLIAALMKAGNATAGYDAANFFDAAHPNYDASGNAITLGNYVAGASPGWYLIDNSRTLKPFIFQTRAPFSLVARMNLTDPNVFDNDEFLWGTRGRMNAGYGLWQLAFFSRAPLNIANLIAARTAMSAIRRPDGTPMGITPDTLVVPSTLFPLATSYFENALVANDPTAPTTLYDNQVRAMFKPVEFKWLN